MAVQFELPAEIEQQLREKLGDLNSAAKEAALVELYRQDKLSHHEFSQALGISWLEAEAVLKKHGVTEDLPTAAEINADIEQLRRLLTQ